MSRTTQRKDSNGPTSVSTQRSSPQQPQGPFEDEMEVLEDETKEKLYLTSKHCDAA